MGNEKNGVEPNVDKPKKSRTSSSSKKPKKKKSMKASDEIVDDATSSSVEQHTAPLPRDDVIRDLPIEKSENGKYNSVDIGQISRRFLETPEFNNGHDRLVKSELIQSVYSSTQPPAIAEGTPMSEAIKANASIRVTKFDKLTRKLKGRAAKKFITRAATLGMPKNARRGKPPRVPHHPNHWQTVQNDVARSYPEVDLRAGHLDSALNPIVETNDVYIQPRADTSVSDAVLPIPVQESEGEESLHERRGRRHRRKKKKKKRAYVKGKVIDGKHELYALSIAVMLGLRTSIGMTNGQLLNSQSNPSDDAAKKSPSNWLTSDDFMAVEKYAFRPKGGPKTPPHVLSHTFKFKDYSPKAFAYVRRLFGVNEYDFLSSVCGNANFIEFISNAKSGQFFFYSSDGKYMIKTMTNDESKFLRRILPHYFRHCVLNPNTLLVRFFGMYRVKMYHLRRNTKFVIMNSVYDTNKYLDTFYDLKGSVTGRDANPTEEVKKDNDVRRDLPNTSLSMFPEVREKMRKQLESDAAFLSSMKIMDYSMLIGVHHVPLVSADADAAAPFTSMDRSENSSVDKSPSIRNVLSKRSRPGRDDHEQQNHGQGVSHDNDKTEVPSLLDHDQMSPSFSERFLNQELNNKQYCNENSFLPDTDFPGQNVPFSVAVSTGTVVDAEYEDDDDSYLDGEHNRFSSLVNSKQQTFQPESSIEFRKLEASEQVYWPFQRIFDSLGYRRMVPILTPIPNDDDRQDSSNSTVSTKWELPDFVSPISNRKDAGHISQFDQYPKIPLTSNNAPMQHCGGKIFYMGIIDVLQQFNTRKRLEAQYRRLWGSGWADASCVHPILYADRFLCFFDEYTKQYGTDALDNPASSTNQVDGDKDHSAVHAPIITLDDISDDGDEHVETVVFFDKDCEQEKNIKVEISASNTQRAHKSKSRKKPSRDPFMSSI